MLRLSRVACLLTLLLITTSLLFTTASAADRFELRDGDRVVLLGGAMVEQEQRTGSWETLLTAAYPDHNVTFRNLGWSGDTVWGESRGMFEPQQGYDRLIEHVKQVDPTLILIAYGNNEAFGGEERLEPFAAQLKKLVADLSAEGRRFVFVSPLLMEASQLPLDAQSAKQHATRYNRNVVHYADVIRRIARETQQTYLDLQVAQLRETDKSASLPLTDNGLRLTPAGYRRTARWIASQLIPAGDVDRLARVVDLDFDSPPARKLTHAIVDKNQLYFHRWRPQNFTYLFGFRQHEQGNNASEIPQFDPLIAAVESTIADLCAAPTLVP